MNKINFLNQTSFPLSSNTLEFMQEMIRELGKLTALGGSSYILSGCKTSGNNVSEGYIVVNGELVFFNGGTLQSTFIILENSKEIEAEGNKYPNAYILRKASFGSGSPQYLWNDLKPISDLLSLKNSIDNLQKSIIINTPSGIIATWAGSTAPSGWAFCDGTERSKEIFPELFTAIGYKYGGAGDKFNLPNTKGRFIVGTGKAAMLGYYDLQPNYSLGTIGGENSHELTLEEIPRHDHIKDYRFRRLSARAADKNDNSTAGSIDKTGSDSEYCVAGMSVDDWSRATIQPVGENKHHENRPPFLALNYIIKL